MEPITFVEPRNPAVVGFEPLTAADRDEIGRWRYEPPYDFHNIDPADAISLESVGRDGNGCYAIRTDDGVLVGYVCFGAEGWVPGQEPAVDGVLDFGMGLRPDLLGRGLGTTILPMLLTFASRRCRPTTFRTAIRTSNERSQRMCTSAGFTESRRFDDGRGHDFVEMTCLAATYRVADDTAPVAGT